MFPETATGISAILAGTSTITTLVGDVFTMITSNPLLSVFAACGLLGVGIALAPYFLEVVICPI